jgi:flagellar motor component MotA
MKSTILRTIACLGVAFTPLFGLILMGGNPLCILFFSEIIIVFGMTFFAIFASYGRLAFYFTARGVIALFHKPESNPEFAKIAAAGCRYARGATVISLVLGLITVLRSDLEGIDDNQIQILIGFKVGAALTSLLHGIFLSEFFFGHLRNLFSKD